MNVSFDRFQWRREEVRAGGGVFTKIGERDHLKE
jgi:hypothetical protein